MSSAPVVAHNLLRAHGTAVQVFRAEARGQIGLVVNLEPKYPASDAPADLAATARADAYMNRQYLDPLFHGRYPEEMPAIFGTAWPRFPATDFALIREPIDFLGVNYYTRAVTRDDDSAVPVRASTVMQPQSRYTEMEWEVWPAALTRVLVWIKERYGDIPLYITENGAAFADPPSPIVGRIDDPLRVDYLRTHLRAVQDAIAAGVDLRGYFAWSLLDNVEWAAGTSKRFGLVHVDFENQLRTPKASAHFYATSSARGALSSPATVEQRLGLGAGQQFVTSRHIETQRLFDVVRRNVVISCRRHFGGPTPSAHAEDLSSLFVPNASIRRLDDRPVPTPSPGLERQRCHPRAARRLRPVVATCCAARSTTPARPIGPRNAAARGRAADRRIASRACRALRRHRAPHLRLLLGNGNPANGTGARPLSEQFAVQHRRGRLRRSRPM